MMEVETTTIRRSTCTYTEEQLQEIVRLHVEMSTDIPWDFDRQELRVEFDYDQVLRCHVTIIDIKEGES